LLTSPAERSEIRGDRLEQPVHVLGPADVGLDGQGAPAARPHLGDQVFGGGAVGAEGDDDVVPVSGQPTDDGRADAAPAAGHQSQRGAGCHESQSTK